MGELSIALIISHQTHVDPRTLTWSGVHAWLREKKDP